MFARGSSRNKVLLLLTICARFLPSVKQQPSSAMLSSVCARIQLSTPSRSPSRNLLLRIPKFSNRQVVPHSKSATSATRTSTEYMRYGIRVMTYLACYSPISILQAGSDANCTKPICCRNFADHVGPITVPAGPSGSLHCDTPTKLVESMLGAVSAQNPRFSLFTGDVVEGDGHRFRLWSFPCLCVLFSSSRYLACQSDVIICFLDI